MGVKKKKYCMFYELEKRRCKIYPIRPITCKTYPLTMKYYNLDVIPVIDGGYRTVIDAIQHEDLKEYMNPKKNFPVQYSIFYETIHYWINRTFIFASTMGSLFLDIDKGTLKRVEDFIYNSITIVLIK